ncbi:MAG TPA: hypothetical protein VK996_20615, partial [Ramlibacter sp.]|nr:hypothetical protein [Ramlibacter sp.]
VIRGEGASQTDSALRELIDFIRPTGLSVTPVLNIKETAEVTAAIRRPVPPCWVYGNPVVGLVSGYRPVAVNTDPIQSSVLILGDMGTVKDDKPKMLKDLPPDQQARVLAKLKTTSCFGMKSGVTTTLVQAQKLCGTVVEVVPQQGLGQSYLPTKAAFHWQADRWVGLITRLQTAQGSTMKGHHGTDERIHLAQLVIVPATHPSWGYGLYVNPAAPAEATKKATALFAGLKGGSPMLMKALDLGKNFEYTSLSDSAVQAMKKSLGMTP